MLLLWIAETGQKLGELTEVHFRFLTEHLALEGPEDVDYHITGETVDYLQAQGADAGLVDLLRRALEMVPGQREVTVSWRPTAADDPEPRGPFR